MQLLRSGDNNRKATPGRIIVQEPIFVKRQTKFGPVSQRTNRFRAQQYTSVPNYSRIMTAREKEIRKSLKKFKGSYDVNGQRIAADLRKELNLILNPPVEV